MSEEEGGGAGNYYARDEIENFTCTFSFGYAQTAEIVCYCSFDAYYQLLKLQLLTQTDEETIRTIRRRSDSNPLINFASIFQPELVFALYSLLQLVKIFKIYRAIFSLFMSG